MPRGLLPFLSLLALALIAVPAAALLESTLVPAFASDATVLAHVASIPAQPRAVPLLANFTWTPPSPVAGEPVQFNDTSSGIPAWWEWDFGDGTPGSTEQNPTHTYALQGNYTVLLNAYPPGSEIGRTISRTIAVAPAAVVVPGGTALPTDTDADGLYDDVNGNGRRDFADVVLYFNQMTWIAANEPVSRFDCNGNARIDFDDVVRLFNAL